MSDDLRGTVARIDAQARLRAGATVRLGRSISLARVLEPDPTAEPVKCSVRERFEPRGRLTVGFDHQETAGHGIELTHIDALNHYGVDGEFFGDVPIAEADRVSVANWGTEGIVTRAVLLDVTEVRGSPWVDESGSVTADELDAALQRAGGQLDVGDGVLIYMGRDRFEAAGHRYQTMPETQRDNRPRSGLGVSAAEWLAQRGVAVVCWDFLDASSEREAPASVHLLIWAIGLALVDNCDFAGAWAALREADRADGMLVIAPLRLPRATASLVNPLLII